MKTYRILVAVTTLVFLLLAGLAFPGQAQPVKPGPLLQATDGYPGDITLAPTLENGYPGNETPTQGSAGNTPTSALATATPDRLVSPTGSGTAPSGIGTRDIFGTENAEMNGAKVTPPASETPGPSPTVSAALILSTPEARGFVFDGKMFSIGFAIPFFLALILWLGYRLYKSGEFQ